MGFNDYFALTSSTDWMVHNPMNCLPKSSIRKISEIYWKYSFWYGIFCSIFVQFHSDINEFLILYRRYIVIISSSLINEVSYVNLMYSNSRHHFRTHFRTAHQSDFLMTFKIPKVCKLFGFETLKLRAWKDLQNEFLGRVHNEINDLCRI